MKDFSPGQKLISGIEPLHDEALNCFQDLLWSVARWWGRGYELMFVEAWGFMFQPPALEMDFFGERIGAGAGNWWEYLEKFHGIRVTIRHLSPPETLEVTKNELAAGRPVLILLDAYSCPWDTGYRQHHSTHGFLAVGLDEERMYCVDGFFNIPAGILPMANFYEGGQGCVTFMIVGDEAKEPDWREIVQNAVARVQGRGENSNAFAAIRQMADELPEVLDLKTEATKQAFFWHNPLNLRLLDVSRGRRQLAKSLQYLADRYDLADLRIQAQNLEQAGWNWDTIRSLLIKASMINSPVPLLKRVADKIRDVAGVEEKIAENLPRVCQGVAPTPAVDIMMISVPKINPTADAFTRVDLTAHLNNQGFGRLSVESRADLIGNNSAYFLTENLPEEKIWRVGDMEFLFPDLSEGLKDNISCNGQTITVPPGCYSRIMVLGCAEWTNFSDRMVVQNAAGEVEPVPLEFSDWSFPPVFGEIKAWSGRGAKRTKEGVEPFLYMVSLYAKSYPLKLNGPIVRIRLPECPNLHVFAISLQDL